MSPGSLAEMAAQIAASGPPLEALEFGPWLGSVRSLSPDQVSRDYMTTGSNFLYVPRLLMGSDPSLGPTYGTFRRRGGQSKLYDAGNAGLLPAHWLQAAAPLNAKARWAEEFLNTTLTSDGVPTTAWLITKEAMAAPLDDGRFSQFYIRDQVNNAHYTFGSEFGTDTYPIPGAEQAYKIVPLWYDSGQGGLTRGDSEFSRRMFFCGSRRFLKVGRWHYWPSALGIPSRALIEKAAGTAASSLQADSDITPSGTLWGIYGSAPAATNWQSVQTADDGVTFIGAHFYRAAAFIFGVSATIPNRTSFTISYRGRREGVAPNADAYFVFEIVRADGTSQESPHILCSTLGVGWASFTTTVTFPGGAGVGTNRIKVTCVDGTGGDKDGYAELTYIAITGEGAVTASNRLIPSGPLPPVHAGTISPGTVVASVSGSTQTLAPDADTAAGGWTPTGAASLFGAINEATPSDAQYMACAGAGAVCRIRLSNVAIAPQASDTVTVRFRAAFTVIAKTLTVELYDTVGPTLQASKVVNLTGGYVDYSFVLTTAQKAAITAATSDWSALELRFTVGAGAGNGNVSYAAVTDDSSTNVSAGWLGHDRFYYSVAYRFEDGSVWAFCTPRAPNDTLPDGYNLATIDATRPTTAFSSIFWRNIPIGPYGVVSRLLLRTFKIDSTTADTAQLDPHAFNVVWEIKDNITTQYEDFFADDDSLQSGPVVDLFIREDHIMPPRARYIFGGDMRVCHSYAGQNPCAIMLAPVGFAADYDRNLPDTAVAAYKYDTGRFFLGYDSFAAAYTLQLIRQNGGGSVAITIDLTVYNTLQKLVDYINTTTFASTCGQWRAQLCPGVNPDALTASALTPQSRIVGQVFYTAGSKILSCPTGGMTAIAVGARIFGSAAWTSQYVVSVDSDVQVTLNANAPSSGSDQLSFWCTTEENAGTAADDIAQRVIANSLPGFIYFSKSYLDADPIHKQDVFMTVASPGSTKSAANCFSGKQSNRFAPPNAHAGISMGGGAVDQGFVVPFANAVGVIRNTRDYGSGVDEDYRLHMLNESRGCCAWNTVSPGNRFVPYLTPHGLFAADLTREVLLSEAIFRHPQSDATLGIGDLDYEIPLCMAATAADTDAAYASLRIARATAFLNYRGSGTRPDSEGRYDFSGGVEHAGLAALMRADGRPWGWSTEQLLATPHSLIVAGRRGDGEHLYGWSEENAGAADGRIDEFETGETDNGAGIVADVRTPYEKGDEQRQVSGQEVVLEHTSPAGSTGFLDYYRSYVDDIYSLTPSTSSAAIIRDVKLLPQAGRAQSAVARLGFRQLTGSAREVRKMTLRLYRVYAFK